MKKLLWLILVIIIPFHTSAKTIILEGNLDSKIKITHQMRFDIPKPLESLSFQFALPRDFSNRFVTQRIENLNIWIEPKPEKFEKQLDQYGNLRGVASWKNLNDSVKIQISFVATVSSVLKTETSRAEFPLKEIPEEVKFFLKSTSLIQSDSEEIKRLAQNLTKDVTTEYEAVTKILNWVADNVKYIHNPPQFDALWTLKTGKGNCQNFAHIAIALLRASGIPARVVGGITLKEPWKIPLGKSYLVQSMGQGAHAWIEIYFPDLGWLSYDPQQSKQFTSTRHIKQSHALDTSEIHDTWKAYPYLPSLSEDFEVNFLYDRIKVLTKDSEASPKAYLLSNKIITPTKTSFIEKPHPPPPQPATPLPTPPQPAPPQEKVFEFGNLEFPNLVELYQVSGDVGRKILDKETAEYVTSRHIYAQAFRIDETLEIKKISLAMRKFGGDGTIYIDLVRDKEGKPDLVGFRSNPVFLDNISRKPGYYWIDFTFPEKIVLSKGRYWIVLRHSGDAIMNWFYIPGNPYGDADDTRSTLKGHQWEDIFNFDFVFKVKAERQ